MGRREMNDKFILDKIADAVFDNEGLSGQGDNAPLVGFVQYIRGLLACRDEEVKEEVKREWVVMYESETEDCSGAYLSGGSNYYMKLARDIAHAKRWSNPSEAVEMAVKYPWFDKIHKQARVVKA